MECTPQGGSDVTRTWKRSLLHHWRTETRLDRRMPCMLTLKKKKKRDKAGGVPKFQIQIMKDRWDRGRKRKVEQVVSERILDGYDINITVERTGNNTKD